MPYRVRVAASALRVWCWLPALQRGTLILPRHPGLLAELRGLVYEQTASGGLKIGPAAGRASPDQAMALMQSTRAMLPGPNPDHRAFGVADLQAAGAVQLACGTWFPTTPRAEAEMRGFIYPQGTDSDRSAW